MCVLRLPCYRCFLSTPALAADSLNMESMMALIGFLLTVPEHACLSMAEVAVTILLGEGLVDLASCLMGNVASTSPPGSAIAEVFYHRSLDLEPENLITGNIHSTRLANGACARG